MCTDRLISFFEEKFPHIFTQSWTSAQRNAIDGISLVLKSPDLPGRSGLIHKVVTLPRGGGSTSILLASVLWAIGQRLTRYVLIVGRTSASAQTLLERIRIERDENQHLSVPCMPPEDTSARVVAAVGQNDSFAGTARRCGDQLCRPDLVFIDNGIDRSRRARATLYPLIAGLGRPGVPLRVIEFLTEAESADECGN